MQSLSATIRVRYQPVIRLADMRVQSAEVLVRAVGIDGSVNGPEAIVHAMTSGSKSMAVTKSIMQLAAAEYTEYEFEALQLVFAFNLPLDALLHPDLFPMIDAVRGQSELPADRIAFELTERHPVYDIAGVGAVIAALRDAGYGLALDDITPGMVNLGSLLNLPIQAIKLDRSITTGASATDHDFIRSIAAHGRVNRQLVIAEGIETQETSDRVLDLGVTHGQGFLFSKPLAAAALPGFLGRWADREAS